MTTRLRLTLAAAALSATALIASGCAAPAPAPSASATDTPATTTPVTDLEANAAWLDDGRSVAVVTWGSSSCVPVAEAATANGQIVTVELIDLDPHAVCTADFAPRASGVALPEGVDPTQDVELRVAYKGATAEVVLGGQPELTGVPGTATDYLPSAGWFDESGIVLLSWGSSTCPPRIENLEETEAGATVTVAVDDGPCTMDMAPRLTMLGLGAQHAQAGFLLTLAGAPGFDGVTIPVIPN